MLTLKQWITPLTVNLTGLIKNNLLNRSLCSLHYYKYKESFKLIEIPTASSLRDFFIFHVHNMNKNVQNPCICIIFIVNSYVFQTLLPLVNAPLLDYTLEALGAAGIEQVIVFCCAHSQKIKDHIRYLHQTGLVAD